MDKSTPNILNSNKKQTNTREHKNSSLKTQDHPHKISTTIYTTLPPIRKTPKNISDPIHRHKKIKQRVTLTSTNNFILF
jgi:hypothetical protein